MDLQDTIKQTIYNFIFTAYYFSKVNLHHFSKIELKNSSKKVGIKVAKIIY